MMEEQYDQGRSWAVAIAAAVINLVIGGLARTSGLFFVAFIKDYGVDRKTASFPITVQYCCLFLTGPIVGILGQKYCSSKIILIGGIFGTLSTALCFLPLNIMWITLFWGVCYGISGGLVTFIPQMVITKYFKKHTATASGIGVSGGCLGCFVLPEIFEKFYAECGLEGTFLIMAGLVAQILPAALLLKDPPWTKGNKVPKSIEDVSTSDEHTKNLNISQVNDGTMELPNTQLLRNNNRLVEELLMAEYRRESTLRTIVGNDVTGDDVSDALQKLYCVLPKESHYTNLAFNDCEEFPSRDPEKPNFSQSNGGSVETKNVFADATDASNFLIYTILESLLRTNQETLPIDPELSGVLSELNKLYSTGFSITKVERSLRDLEAPEIKFEPHEKFESKREAPTAPEETIANIAKRALKLYTKPIFASVGITRTYFSITFLSIATIIVDFAYDKGMGSEEVRYVIMVLAAGDLCGRLCFGWITDRGYMSMARYVTFVVFAEGAVGVCLPLVNTTETLFLSIAAYGVLQGMLAVTFPVLVAKYMIKEEQVIAFGCINFYSGIVGILMPFYIGFFRDQIGAYDDLFYVSGVLALIVGVIWIFEPYFI